MEFKIGNYFPSLLFFFALEFALVAAVMGMDLSWLGFALTSLVLFTMWLVWVNRKRMEPMHFILVGVGGFVLFGAIALTGIVMWIAQSSTPSAQVNELHRDVEQIKANLKDFILPRDLAEDQKKTFIDYLLPRGHGSIRIVFENLDSEASNFAKILNKTIERSGWRILRTSPNSHPLPEGVHIQTWIKRGEEIPHEATLLQQAFQEANIPLMGVGSGGGEETIIELRVGPRPKTLREKRLPQ